MIDIIYYINLEKRKDRREHIKKTLKDAGVFEISNRINAVLNENNGAMGCSMSHIKALEEFIESRLETALIIEDDLKIKNTDSFLNDLKLIFENKINFDVIQISGNHLKLEDCEYSFLKKVINSQTTSGYIVSKNFSKMLLSNFKESLNLMIKNGKRYDNCLDIYWKILQPNNNWFAFNPPLGTQISGYSDIEKKETNYGN